MKKTTAHALAVAAVIAATFGCQSGPRGWAWWKKDGAPTDTSVVARSADPKLPSAQSMPQAVSPDGLQPATSPSAANLAAAGAATTPGISVPPLSSTAGETPPLANYSAVDAAVDKLTGGSAAASATPTSPSSSPLVGNSIAALPANGTAAHVPPMSVPTTGPYDPNSYKPSTSATSSNSGSGAASVDRYQMAGADRYGSMPASEPISAAPAPVPQSVGAVPAASPATVATAGDRYGLGTPAATTTTAPPTTSVTSTPSSAAIGSTTAAPPITPTSATGATGSNTVASLVASPSALPTSPSAPVATTAQAGQYRPGGTSTYTGTRPAQHLEVATRPAPAASTSVAPTTTAQPATGSVPWTPPTTSSSSPVGSRY